ncbi:MAG: AraC family transcriptional regulator [Clostridia bacterium]|nr:AraC family transcriptional regulator [Clostridia bacterium]
MYNGIEKINQVVEYIESHLTEQIDCATLSKLATLSEYEFRRIFSFVIGIPVAEYIRKRRLSMAAEELKAANGNISEIGAKYGYDSSSSFTRAFKEAFDVSPQEARSSDVRLSIFLKPQFQITVQGGGTLEYTERVLEPFCIKGICGTSPISDTCCCESVWAEYEVLADETDSENDVYAAYVNGERDVLCYIGERVADMAQGDGTLLVVGGRWLCFDVEADSAESEINDLYNRINYSFLPSGIYERDPQRPNVERFSPDGSFTVMIPVKGKSR